MKYTKPFSSLNTLSQSLKKLEITCGANPKRIVPLNCEVNQNKLDGFRAQYLENFYPNLLKEIVTI